MVFEEFEQNILDMIEEQQLKLGYIREAVTIYYMYPSVQKMIKEEISSFDAEKKLHPLVRDFTKKYGEIRLRAGKGRLSVTVMPEAGEYVHRNISDSGFLSRFIGLIKSHDTTIDDIRGLFCEYSDSVHFEKTDNGEFDYLMYFENGTPDAYRYCISDEKVHFTYHRYTKSDFEDFGF